MWELFQQLQSSPGTHTGRRVVWAAAAVSECIQEHPGIIFQWCSNFTSVYELRGEQPVSHTIIINLEHTQKRSSEKEDSYT